MKTKIILILFLLFNSFLFPQNSWQKLNGPPGANIISLYIKGDTLLAGRSSYKTIYIYYTSFDGGENWKEHKGNISNVPFEWSIGISDFEISDNKYFAASANHGVFRSTDLENWEKLNVPGKIINMGHDYSGSLYAGTYNDGKIYQSSDKGDSWKLVYSNSEGGEIWDFILKPDSILLISAANKLLQKRPDNTEWDSIVFPQLQGFDLMVDDMSNIYVQSGLTMLRSGDEGLNWIQLPTQSFFWGNDMNDFIFNKRVIGSSASLNPYRLISQVRF